MGNLNHAYPTESQFAAIITRQTAIALGLRHYFTCNRCKRGHLAQRFTSDARDPVVFCQSLGMLL